MGYLDKQMCPIQVDGAAGKVNLSLPESECCVDQELSWGKKVVEVLYLVRRHLISEYDPKKDDFIPTHFCSQNIAFFDFKKESNAGFGPPLHELTLSDLKWIEDSVNVISLKVLKSDVGYPISLFGTVVARDQIDYRCVYLFRRDRDDPQVIASPKDTLTLTGPDRGLSVIDSMFFEINLKINNGGNGTADKDFSKGVIEHNAIFFTKQPRSHLLTSRLSTMKFVYTPVPSAVEAKVEVNILKGPSNFSGKVTAWTTEDKSHIILYDCGAAGTLTAVGDDKSIMLSRRLVAVPLNEGLVLEICVLGGGQQAERFELTLGQSDEECVCEVGSYRLQLKVTWTGGMIRRRRPNMWENLGGQTLLL